MHRSLVLVLVLVLAPAVLGCGDNTAASPDGGTAASALVVLKDGNASLVNLKDRSVQPRVAPAMAISTDAMLRPGDGVIYVVNRWGFDNLVILDAADLHVIRQISTGAGSNPQDVAVVAPDRLFVPLQTPGSVLVLDPTRPEGQEAVGTVDLTTIDAHPTPSSALVAGGEVLVALGFIDPTTYAPTRAGMIAVIDPATLTVTARIDMQSQNPFARMQVVPGSARAVVDGAADFSGTAGCFELVDAAARTSTCVVTNAACGGWSGALTVTTDAHVFAAVEAGFQADGTVCHFTLDGTVVGSLAATGGSLTDVAVAGAEVLVVDSKAPGGLRVFDRASGAELTTAPLDLGAPSAFASGIVLLN
ncbi:MAG TPA: hypothetical protein VGQ83_36510 [Polyangia bacterium]